MQFAPYWVRKASNFLPPCGEIAGAHPGLARFLPVVELTRAKRIAVRQPRRLEFVLGKVPDRARQPEGAVGRILAGYVFLARAWFSGAFSDGGMLFRDLLARDA